MKAAPVIFQATVRWEVAGHPDALSSICLIRL